MKNLGYNYKPLSEGLALYIHLPFCWQKCGYCDFYSLAQVPENLVQKTIERISEEFYQFVEKLQIAKLKTIYLGGGTPSLIPQPLLEKLFKVLKPFVVKNKTEWTIEANPESVNPEFLALAADYGINRLSLGLQTFSSRLLNILKRKTDVKTIQRALVLISENWPYTKNIDLIYAIPTQTQEEFKKDLLNVLKFKPQHLSLYALSLELGTELANQLKAGHFSKFAEKDELEMEKLARIILQQEGFERYEISNYCMPNYACQHNLTYWKIKPYLGIGPSAASTLILNDDSVIRLEYKRDLNSFLKRNSFYLNCSKLKPKSLLLEHFIMGLRLKAGIDYAILEKRFPTAVQKLKPLLRSWQAKGYLCKKIASQLRCTVKGQQFLNILLKELVCFIGKIKIDQVFWP